MNLKLKMSMKIFAGITKCLTLVIIVTTKGHDEYKDVLLNKKCFRHSMNKI